MDALSDILRVVGLTGGVFLEAEFTEPWSVAGQVSPEFCRPFMLEPQQVVCFHYVAEGSCELRVESGLTLRIVAGQAVMLPRNHLHVFGSGGNVAVVSAKELIRSPNGLGVARIVHGGGGARTRLVCGFLGGNEQLRLLLSPLPIAMKIDVASLPGGDWISRTFAYAAQTLADGDPGSTTVLTKLSELLFVEALRRYLSELPADGAGWLAGLRDPVVGRALSLLHSKLEKNWTTDELARAVGMSRSAFADRFTAIIGQPPGRYLMDWRMQLARQQLRQTRRTVAQIAFEVGYESEAAFTRAFHRECGAPPAAWRKQSAQ